MRELNNWTNIVERWNEVKKMSVKCFSALKPIDDKSDDEPESILMWSHYADGHKGICMVFDTSSYVDNEIGKHILRPVDYDLKILEPNFNSEVSEDEMQRAVEEAMLRKAKFWDYEKEWRLLVAGEPGNFSYYPIMKLKGIYLGSKISKEDKELIEKIAADKGIKGTTHETRLDNNCYKIVIRDK